MVAGSAIVCAASQAAHTPSTRIVAPVHAQSPQTPLAHPVQGTKSLYVYHRQLYLVLIVSYVVFVSSSACTLAVPDCGLLMSALVSKTLQAQSPSAAIGLLVQKAPSES
jgi:hypothetical protein